MSGRITKVVDKIKEPHPKNLVTSGKDVDTRPLSPGATTKAAGPAPEASATSKPNKPYKKDKAGTMKSMGPDDTEKALHPRSTASKQYSKQVAAGVNPDYYKGELKESVATDRALAEKKAAEAAGHQKFKDSMRSTMKELEPAGTGAPGHNRPVNKSTELRSRFSTALGKMMTSALPKEGEVLEKPSVSQAQNRFVHAKAAEGEGWAKEWEKADEGRDISKLPEKVEKADGTPAWSSGDPTSMWSAPSNIANAASSAISSIGNTLSSIGTDSAGMFFGAPGGSPTPTATPTPAAKSLDSFTPGQKDKFKKASSLPEAEQSRAKHKIFRDRMHSNSLKAKREGREALATAKRREESKSMNPAGTGAPNWKRPSVEKTEKLEGGLADGMADSSFSKKSLNQGKKIEMEHTKDPQIAKEIAKDHMEEHGEKYYGKLKEMEAELEKSVEPTKVPNGPLNSARIQMLKEEYKSLTERIKKYHDKGTQNQFNEVEEQLELPKQQEEGKGAIYSNQKPAIITPETPKDEKIDTPDQKTIQDNPSSAIAPAEKVEGEIKAEGDTSVKAADGSKMKEEKPSAGSSWKSISNKLRPKEASSTESMTKSKPVSNSTVVGTVEIDGKTYNYRMQHGVKRITNGDLRGKYVHRVLKEKEMGRKLKDSEEVHHVKHDRSKDGAEHTHVMDKGDHAAETNHNRAKEGFRARYVHSRDGYRRSK